MSFVRVVGQRVDGQVTGLPVNRNNDAVPSPASAGEVSDKIKEPPAAILYVCSKAAINNPMDYVTNLTPCFSAVKIDADGHFRTALLEPGTYTLIAEAYEWGEATQKLAYVGSAKVAVTTNQAPSPLKIELRPWGDATNRPFARP